MTAIFRMAQSYASSGTNRMSFIEELFAQQYGSHAKISYQK
jgi:hypothetical protein